METSTKLDLIEFRDFCLSLGEVTEKTPFGKFARRYESVLVFYVAGHMFCFVDMNDFSYVNLRLTPDRVAEVRDNYCSVSKPINQSLKYWIQLNFGGDIPDSTIRQLVAEAYNTVKAKYTK